MSQGPRYSLRLARSIAEDVLNALGRTILEGMIVGSIRRGVDVVGDIELVVRPEPRHDLIGQAAETALDALWNFWRTSGRLLPGRANGAKYKQAKIPRGKGPPIPLDLYLATADNYGYIVAIRTGPRAYSKALVTPVEHGGLLETGYQCRDGGVFHRGVPIRVPTEREFLAIAGGWVDPSERGAAAAAQRQTVPNTRRAAHHAFREHTGRVAARILGHLAQQPSTCEELEQRLDLKHQTVSATLTGLLKADQVRIVGQRRNASGRAARVYATPEGDPL